MVDEIEIPGSRGSANYVSRCKFCKREGVASIVAGPNKYSNDANAFQTILVLDCRGIEPVEFDFRRNWEAVGPESNSKFAEIDLSENEFFDYDEKGGNEVSIVDLEYKFVRA
ncbi:UPF0587 protein [Smittium culicis]|uniref:UPF0587 protein n=1 Tax=Smittium culicis TaxID=133412 RepID=A0A1R1YSI3_9FUNG|nr:UPF0587 protein [Smittium culicis]